jgi:metal-responsive CopG/Arc/MetJ family transcriptional regulator
MQHMKRFTVNLPDGIAAIVEKSAKANKRSVSAEIAVAIEATLAKKKGQK